MAMKTYLVQRGSKKDTTEKTGIDAIIRFDYMGASEYEWGALPESLKRIREKEKDYTYLDIPIYGKVITVFCRNEVKQDAKQLLEDLAARKMHTKCYHAFDHYVKPSEHEAEWQKKHPLTTNFWWDLENDMMFWVKDHEFEAKFKQAIVKKHN